jgi:leader peptidase (prepilin peptidase) / N-methyltransferase
MGQAYRDQPDGWRTVDLPSWAAAAGMLLAGLAAGSIASLLAVRIPARRDQRPSQARMPRASRPPGDPGLPPSDLRLPPSDPGLPPSDVEPPPSDPAPAGDRAPPGYGPLQPADLIPLTGWLRLRNRSAAGRAELGIWYPAAELITAGLFVALWFSFGPSPVLPAFCYLAVIAVALAVIDARHKRLPNALTLPAYPVALILLGVGAVFVPGGARHFTEALIAMAAAWAFFMLQAFIYPAGIGWGDVKLSGVLGLYLGWFGARALLAGLFGGYLLAAVAAIGLLLARRATRKSLLPFGPFLLASSLTVIIAGGRFP